MAIAARDNMVKKNNELKNAIALVLVDLKQIADGRDNEGELSEPGLKMVAKNAISKLEGIKINDDMHELKVQLQDQVSDKTIPNAEKLVNWIDDTHRAKPAIYFPEGVERQIAIRFETLFDRLKTLNK